MLTPTPQFEGFRPEWCISTTYHAWDTPFWSGTLNMQHHSIFNITKDVLCSFPTYLRSKMVISVVIIFLVVDSVARRRCVVHHTSPWQVSLVVAHWQIRQLSQTCWSHLSWPTAGIPAVAVAHQGIFIATSSTATTSSTTSTATTLLAFLLWLQRTRNFCFYCYYFYYGAGIAQLVVLGLAVHSVAGSILLWGHFPVEGIFPLESTWVQTPFLQKLFRMRV